MLRWSILRLVGDVETLPHKAWGMHEIGTRKLGRVMVRVHHKEIPIWSDIVST